MKKKPNIGRSESDVLRFIAACDGATVTEVGDHLAETKGQTRSTALSMMERLREKGFLTRTKVDGIFRYFPSQDKGNLFKGFVADFVEGVLGGSVSPLVAYLGSRTEVDDHELAELRSIVENLEEGRRDA